MIILLLKTTLAFLTFLFRGIALIVMGAAAFAGGRPEFSPLPVLPYESTELWQPFVTLRAAGGYRSNPLLGNQAQGTAFGSTGADLFLIRLPTGNATFSAFFSAEDVRYFRTIRPVTNESGGTQEQTFLTDVRMGRGLGSSTNWTLKFEGRHLYNDQYLNTSSFDALTTNLSSLRAATHMGTVIPALEWQGAGGWSVELAAVGTRQIYLNADVEVGLSSAGEVGPRVTTHWRSPAAGSWNLEIHGLHREFDDRVQSTQLGLPLFDTRLRQQDLRVEFAWQRDWGIERPWQTRMRLFHVRRRENGEGYTDYDRLGAVTSVQYQRNAWLARVSGRWSTYDFPRSFLVFGGVLAVRRERETGQMEARVEYRMRAALRLYAEYSWEREKSNRTSDNYHAHVGTLGVERDF